MSTTVRTVNVVRTPGPLDSFDSLDSSHSHRKLRSSLRERTSPPPPPTTMDKAIQCELKRCRKTVQEAARTAPGSASAKTAVKREYSDAKWAYSDQERRAQQSALASAYPNGIGLPDENVLDDRSVPLQFQYSKITKHVPVSSLEQQVSQHRKVTNDYEHDLKFRLYAYKPGMDGKRKTPDINNNQHQNGVTQIDRWTKGDVSGNKVNEVIYSQVDVSKKRSPKNIRSMIPADSPLPDYSDHERRPPADPHQATRPYLISTFADNRLRSRSASPARPTLTTTSTNHSQQQHQPSNERLRTYQFGFQSALTRPPASSRASKPLSPPTTSTYPLSANKNSQLDSMLWPDSAALPSSSQPAPLATGSLLRQIVSTDPIRSPSTTSNNQVTYATLDRQRTLSSASYRDNLDQPQSITKSSRLPPISNSNDRSAYTLDRRHWSSSRPIDRSSPQPHHSQPSLALSSPKSYHRSYALNRSAVSNSCNDLIGPPSHVAPSPPPPPPQFSDGAQSLGRYNRSHVESDYLQPRRCTSRISVAYGSNGSSSANTLSNGSSSSQRRSHSLSRPIDSMPITRNRSPTGSVRKMATSQSSIPTRAIVTRSASMSANHGSQRQSNIAPRTASPSYSSSSRAAYDQRPNSRNSTRSHVRVDQPIVVQLPAASTLAQNRRLSASLAGGLNQLSSHGGTSGSPSTSNRPSALYRSSEQVNRLANRMGSSVSINRSPSKVSINRTPSKSNGSVGPTKPPLSFASNAGPQLLASSSQLKRAQSIPKNAKLPLLQKLRSKFGKSLKD